ncbi:helix-turn-helix transcriptional regulator [Amphritea pacifica]|uniref:Helix-turn-helix transcriptional regulator n=1 Tax=Amphritea pacifica TaxID=2811233 RepID=A0ABS2WAA2_9GAMM|nr:helix-turn-helix transcriptional regulator [Amphritea pacifica]MBN0988556.1 helix-turn-helix transcriptional regulator [Amphritea pacifica]MBN1006764.1 helix-turn-helix transcriptional regulator [Amphritea pacifica]
MRAGLNTTQSSLSSLQDESLKLFTDLFGIQKAAAYMVDSGSKMFSFKNCALQPALQREYLEYFYRLDPFHPSNVEDKDTSVLRASDAIALHRRKDNPYYSEFLSRWGIDDTIEIYLHSEGRIVAGLSLFLDEGDSELLSADMKRIESLQKFLQFSIESYLDSPQRRNFEAVCDEYHLTAKERVVLEQVIQGLPHKSIANCLCCSLSTVKTHLQNIFEKMSVRSKAEIISLLYSQQSYH